MIDWNIGIEAWIIQDGNQPDFYKGQIARFALFFQPLGELRKNDNESLQANHIKEAEYTVTGKVIHVGQQHWVADFGLLAYTNQAPPPGLRVGSVFSANIWLGVDYYLYTQSLSHLETIPPMIYSWQVQQIMLQTTPYIKTISTEPGRLYGKEIFVRDRERISYSEINATNAKQDDEGGANYVLICQKLAKLPIKKIS